MARPATILRTGPDDDRDAWRFLAILCFIEFYCQFVTAGGILWRDLHPGDLTRVTFDPESTYYVIELAFRIRANKGDATRFEGGIVL